jgi:hypothetical protein
MLYNVNQNFKKFIKIQYNKLKKYKKKFDGIQKYLNINKNK